MIRFDDAIGTATRAVLPLVRDRRVEVTLVRDASGSVTVVLPNDTVSVNDRSALQATLDRELGRFSPGPRSVVLEVRDLVDAHDVIGSADRIRLPEHPGFWLVDRLLTNQDWLRTPLSATPQVPTATAFSIKGGVGRTTALVVLAWHLARTGRRVLVVDLDLEAPGAGPMLLPAMPDYGVVDWCVESLVGQADDALLETMIAPAPLAQGTNGDILVIPAFGRLTKDYVAKLGRAYMPSVDREGLFEGLAHRLRALLSHTAHRREPPDVVLLDSRAGLHDIGSAAVTQLGAEVFMFARDDAQTWDAYSRLFQHLRMARSVTWGMPDDDLRWRLKMVASQVDAASSALSAWTDRSYSAWTGFYDAETADVPTVAFERDDESAPHHPLPILFDPRVRGYDFVSGSNRPEWAFVESAFGPFLERAAIRLFADAATDASGVAE
jgi:hypothetical protein